MSLKTKDNNEDKIIILNNYLASLINTRLAEMGIVHNGAGFTRDILNQITDLKIDVKYGVNLSGIENLEMLNRLTIYYERKTEALLKRNIASINEDDMKAISGCKSLTDLSIINQAFIEEIDVSGLTQLKSLQISFNQYLYNIKGLENLECLEDLVIYGNNRLYPLKNLNEVILNNENLDLLRLDVLMFPDAIKYDKENGSYDINALKKIAKLNAEWCEQINGRVPKSEIETIRMSKNQNYVKYNTAQMINLHNKSCQIIHDYVPKDCGAMDAVIGIEQYLAQNVKYDMEALSSFNGQVYKSSFNGQIGGTNGSYSAIMGGIAICEGYTHAMQYLLKLKGIRSHNVACYAIASENTSPRVSLEKLKSMSNKDSGIVNDGYLPLNHSIICIDGFYELYDDPTWNASHYQSGDKSFPYMLLSKKEMIEKKHYLSPGEREIRNRPGPSRAGIMQSIEKNELFRNTTVSDINNTVREIKYNRGIGEELIIDDEHEVGE